MANEFSDRDIDADETIKIDALTDEQLAALEFELEPELVKNTANALTSELEAALRRLTPPAPRLEQQPQSSGPPFEQPRQSIAARPQQSPESIASPAVQSQPPEAHVRPQPSAASTFSFLSLFWIIGSAVERFAAAVVRLSLRLRRTIEQLVAGYFTPARRVRVLSLYRAQQARWTAFKARSFTAVGGARRLVVQRFEARVLSRR
jgi:hypothetical protein